MSAQSVDGLERVIVTARCERCADDHPERAAPALALLEHDGERWYARRFEGRRGKRPSSSDAFFDDVERGRAVHRQIVGKPSSGVSLACRLCGARPSVKLAELYRRADSARARRSSTFTIG